MTKVRCCCTIIPYNNDSIHSRKTHILWVKRIFDLILHTNPETGRHIASVPHLKLSFVNIIVLAIQAVIINNPFALSQYIFELV